MALINTSDSAYDFSVKLSQFMCSYSSCLLRLAPQCSTFSSKINVSLYSWSRHRYFIKVLQANILNVLAFKESLVSEYNQMLFLHYSEGQAGPPLPISSPQPGGDPTMRPTSRLRNHSEVGNIKQSKLAINTCIEVQCGKQRKSSSMNATLTKFYKFKPIFLIPLLMGCLSQVNCSKWLGRN